MVLLLTTTSKKNEIATNKIKGLGDFIDEKISGSSTPQDFSANNLTGTYAALDGSNITNLTASQVGAVPYTGATSNLDLGSRTLTTTSTGTFGNIKTPIISPATDSTSALQINKADGITNVLNVDTTNGRVGIGTGSPLARVHIGNGVTNNSVDSQVLISRLVDDTVSGNGHAFSDSSFVTRGGTIAYNSFDGRTFIGGTNNYDHYAVFQNGANYGSSGTMNIMYGFVNIPTVSAGVVTNMYGAYASDPVGSGAVTNNYGVYIPQLSKGTAKNYAVYTAGTTKNFFGGSTVIGGSETYLTMLNVIGRSGAPAIASFKSATAGDETGIRLYSTSGTFYGGMFGSDATGEIRSGGFYSNFFPTFYSNNSERMRISTTGNVGIGTTTPAAALDVNGQVKMQKSSNQPFACDMTHDATMAVTSAYRTCICKGTTTTWVFTTDGTTTCIW